MREKGTYPEYPEFMSKLQCEIQKQNDKAMEEYLEHLDGAKDENM